MIKRNASYHISEDRIDRACFIMQTVGLGEIIKEVRCEDERGRISWQCLTDTGVLLVLNEQKTMAITLYIATQPKVSAMYKGNPTGGVALLHCNAAESVRHVQGQHPQLGFENGSQEQGICRNAEQVQSLVCVAQLSFELGVCGGNAQF